MILLNNEAKSLLKRIEITRKELKKVINEYNKSISNKKVLEESKKLDKLLNKYNDLIKNINSCNNRFKFS